MSDATDMYIHTDVHVELFGEDLLVSWLACMHERRCIRFEHGSQTSY